MVNGVDTWINPGENEFAICSTENCDVVYSNYCSRKCLPRCQTHYPASYLARCSAQNYGGNCRGLPALHYYLLPLAFVVRSVEVDGVSPEVNLVENKFPRGASGDYGFIYPDRRSWNGQTGKAAEHLAFDGTLSDKGRVLSLGNQRWLSYNKEKKKYGE